MKQFRKTAILLFLTVVFAVFTQCEDDTQITETPQPFQVIAFDALPAAIQSKITAAEQALKSSFAHKEDKPFGTVVPTGIHRRLKPDGSASYTLALSRKGEGLYYDNLVINEDANGNLKTHIIRYQPEASWFYQHKTAGLGYEAYSGVITVFNEAGALLSSVNLISGEVEKEAAKTTSSKANAAAGCEILDVQYVGGCAGEDYCWWNEIIITVDCTGTGGGYEDDGINDDFGNTEGEEGGSAGPGGGGAGGTGGPGEPIDTVPVEEEAQIIIDPSFETIDKINCTYQQLLKNTTIKELLDDFFGNDADYDLTFQVVPDLPCGGSADPEACTSNNLGNDGSITISIDQDYINSNQTPTLFIAQTIIHEAIHANLYLALYNYNNGNTVNLPAIDDFPAIYEQYMQMKGWQHEFMANHYVSLMAQTLQEVHPLLNDNTFINSLNNNYPDLSLQEFYTSIAYLGLNGTTGQTNYLSNQENNDNYSISYEAAKVDATKTPNCD